MGTTDYVVKRQTAFNGHSGLVEIEIKTSITDAGQSPRTGVQYLYERFSDSAIFRYGMVIPTVLGQGIPDMLMTTIYEPAVEFKAVTLNVGESYVEEWHSTTMATGGPTGSVSPIKESESDRITYLGQEVITVPAGTFTTCKIHRRSTVADSEVFNWFAKGSGLSVRDLQRTEGKEWLHELLPGATINGAPVHIE